jgi:signal transduction histidine kinase
MKTKNWLHTAAVTLRPTSLTARVTLTFGMATSGALLIAFGIFYAVLNQQLTSAQERGLQIRAGYLASAVHSGSLDTVTRDPLAQFYDPAGNVLVSSTALAGRRLLSVEEAKQLEGRGITRNLNLETSGNAPVRLFTRPLGGGLGLLAVGVSAEPVLNAQNRLILIISIAAPLLIALVVLAGWRVVRAAMAPVDRMAKEAQTISSFESEARLSSVPGGDELARLAQTLDGMLERLRVAFRRERAFVDDASHELRTPIAVMRGELELARLAADTGDAAGLDRSLRAAATENERLARLAEDLLLLARQRAGTLVVGTTRLDLLDLCLAEARRLGPVLDLEVSVSGDLAVCPGDENRLRQVLGNLLQNARGAGAHHVRINLTMHGDSVELAVSDDGPGFPATVLSSAFDRFVRGDGARTRDATGGGAGLGLAIVRAIAAAHGGTVEARNGPPLGGASVLVLLPADPDTEDADEPDPAPAGDLVD